MRFGACLAIVGAALALSPRVSQAHELPGTSATMVVRDGGFVEMRLMVPWSDVLHAQWMPRATRDVFLGTIANQPPAVFARAFAQVTWRIEHELHLVASGTRVLPFAHWRWPNAIDVQTALRTELMARLAAPSADTHAERIAATADVLSDPSLASLQLQTARVLGPTLVTAYRPVEQLVPAGARSGAIAVGKR